MALFPEGTTALASDNEWRLLAKWALLLYAQTGNLSSPFPEGVQPLASDNESRLEQKINIMKSAL